MPGLRRIVAVVVVSSVVSAGLGVLGAWLLFRDDPVTEFVDSRPAGESVETAPAAEIEPNVEVESQTAPEPAVEVESQTAPEPDVEVESQTAPEPAVEVEFQTAPEPAVEVEFQTAPEPAVEVESQTAPEPELQSGVEVEPEVAPEPEVPPAEEREAEVAIETDVKSAEEATEPEVAEEPADPEPSPAVGEVMVGDLARSADTLLAASRGRTCAVRPDATVACWGQDGLRERLSAAGLSDVVAISTGDEPDVGLHVCALHEGGTVSCWGPGLEGQLGQGDRGSRYLPASVPGITDAVAVGAGWAHTCAVHGDGAVSCWGVNWQGQLGDGTEESRLLPQRVPGLEGVVAISAGADSTCAIHVDGALSCWGWAAGFGAPGHTSPKRVGDLPAVVSVAIGRHQTCAVTVDGKVYCWFAGSLPRPVRMAGIDDVVTVAVGDGSVCALHRDGGVSCWGQNNSAGQLGHGTTAPTLQPARLAAISEAVAVSVSWGSPAVGAHACAMHVDGSVSCWGGNGLGQLGDGTYETRLTPTRAVQFETIPADRIPETPTLLLRTWMDTAVAEREAEFPWLRVAWDYIRERASGAPVGSFGGVVHTFCDLPGSSYKCWSDRMEIASMNFGGVVHELAHVYDLTTGLAPRKAWGAVQLYFATTHPDCFTHADPGQEILADIVAHLLVPTTWLTYYRSGCHSVSSEPSREAEEIVLAGLAGEVPDWYTENITNGAELWAALRRGPSPQLLTNLADEFGGFCSTDWFTYPLDPTRFPPEGSNPFKDGGCPG